MEHGKEYLNLLLEREDDSEVDSELAMKGQEQV
jgi:hypothetical protein